MVYGKNIFSHFPDHVVPLDIPAFTCGSIIKPGMEIFITNQYAEYYFGNGDCDFGMAFLGVWSLRFTVFSLVINYSLELDGNY